MLRRDEGADRQEAAPGRTVALEAPQGFGRMAHGGQSSASADRGVGPVLPAVCSPAGPSEPLPPAHYPAKRAQLGKRQTAGGR